ncbi:MAG: fumarate hydratase [Methanosarcinales archaeon]|uniref:Fumarate hydratase n=1 Tax=Candidatus Ethanoperedens thermophilum TaxID=2766897 RepID=A0A848DBL0_9EURY|nr:fumarate hydratase [Candidatus Ethanoperedens thermophilum]
MEHRLTTPLTKEAILKLKAGDILYLTGRVFTARDEAHKHILNALSHHRKLPFDPTGAVIYHCGPLLKKTENSWQVVSAGPTTSERMTQMTPALMDNTGIRAIIGKGGMKGVAPLFRGRCVYLAYTGGCAVLAAEGISRVINVYWQNLGMAEAVWEFEVRDFGPLIVGIDSYGVDLYEKVLEKASESLKAIVTASDST